MKLLITLILLFKVHLSLFLKAKGKSNMKRIKGYNSIVFTYSGIIYNLKLIEFRDGNSKLVFQQKNKSHKYYLEINPLSSIVTISSKKRQVSTVFK